MNAELTRLREWIATADLQTTRWEGAADALARQAAGHRTEHARQAQIVTAADTHASQVRAEVAAPLIALATTDATDYQSVRERMWHANRALQAPTRFGWRAATRTAHEADQAHQDAEGRMRRRWGTAPQTIVDTRAWAQAVAGRRADVDPRVVGARKDAAHAYRQLQDLTAHHADERATLWRSIDDGHRPSNIAAHAAQWRRRRTKHAAHSTRSRPYPSPRPRGSSGRTRDRPSPS